MSYSRIQMAEVNVIPSMYKKSLFAPLNKKEFDILDVEQSMINSVFQNDNPVSMDSIEDDIDNVLPSFDEPIDFPDDLKLDSSLTNSTTALEASKTSLPESEPFPPMSTSGIPEPTLVPGREGGKVKTFYKCEKCFKSFPKRKR